MAKRADLQMSPRLLTRRGNKQKSVRRQKQQKKQRRYGQRETRETRRVLFLFAATNLVVREEEWFVPTPPSTLRTC